MTVHRLKLPHEEPDDLDGFSGLFDDVTQASSHELELALGAVRRPRLPVRDLHPAAQAIPAISNEAFAELKRDIARNGQRRAVVMFQGMIFDGFARYEACVSLGLVPRVRILRDRDPGMWLLRANLARCGEPRSPERDVVCNGLNLLWTKDWKTKAAQQQAEWIAQARKDFRFHSRGWPFPERCAVCGLREEYSHAHHVLPLSVQYEIGIDQPLQDIEWLCVLHHKEVHRLISLEIFGAQQWSWIAANARRPMATQVDPPKITRVLQRGLDLFRAAGGVTPRGNWGMF
jgi:hypothetical protein